MNEDINTPTTHVLPLSKNLIALLVVIVVVVSGGSGALGAYIYTSSAAHQSPAAGAPSLPNPTPPHITVHTTAGTVASITGNTLILAPSNTTAPNSTVLIAPSTTIIEFTLKNPKAFQAQMAAFIKARKAGSKAVQPRPDFATTTLGVADLSTGDHIIVTSTQNIVDLEKFTASKIQVYPKPPAHH